MSTKGRVVRRRASFGEKRKRELICSVYDEYPDYHITLNEFEQLGKKRFRLLKWIESQKAQNKPIDVFEAKFLESPPPKPDILAKMGEFGLYDSKVDARADAIGHFVLRLACCTTEERAKWFVNFETILFDKRYVLNSETQQAIALSSLNISSEILTKQAFLTKYPMLNGLSPLPRFSMDSTAPYENAILPLHRVPFHEVSELVGQRKVLIHKGYAFVPNEKFHNVVRGRFRARLNRSLAMMRREHTINRMKEDESASRMVPILENILKGMDNTYKSTKLAGNAIRASQIKKLKANMPLCMRQIITEDCEKKGYARHWGILHLSLFLKGIGMPLDQAAKFWTKSMKDGKKGKEVVGNLNHMYGKTGARRDYSPFGCQKLFESVKDTKPEKGCHYGCPFVYYSATQLVTTLRNMNLNDNDCTEVVKYKSERQYTLACRKVFEATHRDLLAKEAITIEDVACTWDHPNRYFDTSYHMHNPQLIKELPADSSQPPQKPFIKPNPTPRRAERRATPTTARRSRTPTFKRTPRTTPTFGKRATPVFGKKFTSLTPKPASKPKKKPRFGSAGAARNNVEVSTDDMVFDLGLDANEKQEKPSEESSEAKVEKMEVDKEKPPAVIEESSNSEKIEINENEI